MKKNKLTFLIAASFLALSTIAGCTTDPTSKGSSKEADNSVLPSSDVGGDSNGQSSQGGDNTSQGGGTTTKTDWTDTEKATMRNALHGLVLPFVEMDVSVSVSQSSGSVKIESQENMASGFLASYKAKFDANPEWTGEDISSEYNVYPGNAFVYQRPVTENGKKYYVAVMFTGLAMNQGDTEPHISKDGRFYLEAMDPYVYEYPAAFIGEWLKASFGTNIVPPAFEAEFYSLDSEGVLIGYNETNIENSYKATLETSGKFTIDPEKNAQGFYVVHPTDGTYIMYFMYDTTQKIMILKVDVPKGWNNAAINKIFNDNNVTPFSLGSISDPNIRFSASEQTVADATYMTISVGDIDVQGVQAYINSLKALGYKIAYPTVEVESNQYSTTVNVITNEGMFTIYVTYSTAENANFLSIWLSLTPNPYVVKDWPAASVARYLLAEHDTVPAFSGQAYGFNFSVMNTYNNVVVILDNGAESAAKDAYIATLTSAENGYTAHGTLGGQPAFLSPNSEILVAVGCDPVTFPGEINILIQNYTVVETPWPATDVAEAVGRLFSVNPITEALPALDVSDASACYVNGTSDSEQIEIDVDGLGSAYEAVVREFTSNGWTYDAYYAFDSTTSTYGAYVSPQKQLAVFIDVVSGDLVIYVRAARDQYYEAWPAESLNTILAKWGVKKDTLPSFDKSMFIMVNEVSGQQKVEVEIAVGTTVRQTALTDYCVAMERMGYHFDENRGGHISDNHELLVQASIVDNGIKLTISNITLVYKVVGYNSDDWSFANGQLMVDATNPEENYEVQYTASFHVEANAKFKILDSDGNWLGGEIASYANKDNDNFSKLEGGNIQVNFAGTVTVYLKIYEDKSKDMWLEFVKDTVPMAEWPTTQIDATLLAWNVDDEIPVLQNEAIDAVNYAEINEKSFSLTVLGGSSLLADYEALLAENYTKAEGVWSSDNINIDVHANGNDFVIVVTLKEEEPQPEPDFKVVGLDDAWDYDDGLDLTELDAEEGYLGQFSVTFDVEKDEAFKLTNGTAWVGFDKLETNDNFSEGDNHNIVAKENGSVELKFNKLADGSYQIIINFTADEPELKPWPEQEINEYFGDVFTTVPEIKIANASYEITGTDADDEFKMLFITVTVENASEEATAAMTELHNSFGYEYDGTRYVTDREGTFPVIIFDEIGTESFIVGLFQKLEEPAPETVYKLVGLNNDWDFENGQELDEVAEPGEGISKQYTVSFSVNRGDEFKVTDGLLWYGIEELGEHENFVGGGDSNIMAKQSGDVTLTFSILENGTKQVAINFVAADEQPTEFTYTLVTTDNWDNLTDADAEFWAWVWGGDYGDGQWIQLTVDDENHCLYLENINVSATGFKIVRMSPGAEPSFDTAWNQSANDIDFPAVSLRINFNIL